MFEEHRVAGEQRRYGESEDLPQREVPGHHGQNHTERLVDDLAGLCGHCNGFRLQVAGTVFCVVAALRHAFVDLGDRLCEWFPHFCGDQGRQLLPACLQRVGDSAEQASTFLGRDASPGQSGRVGFGEYLLDFGVGEDGIVL